MGFDSPKRTKESLIDRQTVVFCNPFVTQQSTALTELSSKSLILMVPPHGDWFPSTASVNTPTSSDIHCRLMQEATIWSTMYIRSVELRATIRIRPYVYEPLCEPVGYPYYYDGKDWVGPFALP